MKTNSKSGSIRAAGLDSGMRLLIAVTAVMVYCCVGSKWYSVPELKYTKKGMTFYPLRFAEVFSNDLMQHKNFSRMKEYAFLKTAGYMTAAADAAAVILSIYLIACILFFRKDFRKHEVIIVRLTFVTDVILGVLIQAGCVIMNIALFKTSGVRPGILDIALKSRVQLTAVPYIITAAGLISLAFAGRVRPDAENDAAAYRSELTDGYEKKRLKVSAVLILAVIPFTVFFGIFFLNDRNYYFISIVIAVLSMMPFFMVFENKKPRARELVITAVMTAVCIAGRAAFFMVPFFKPVFALIIINGAIMGAESGFLTGALTAFGSDFIFGQGPWTPWQMFCMGIIGFLSGVVFNRLYRINTPERQESRRSQIISLTLLSLFSVFCTVFVYGFIMDTATVFMYSDTYPLKLFRAAYISGFPVNLMHAGSTVLFLIVLWRPMSRKLDRVKIKYGIFTDAVSE